MHLRHRRSKSSHEVWLEHKPEPVPVAGECSRNIVRIQWLSLMVSETHIFMTIVLHVNVWNFDPIQNLYFNPKCVREDQSPSWQRRIQQKPINMYLLPTESTQMEILQPSMSRYVTHVTSAERNFLILYYIFIFFDKLFVKTKYFVGFFSGRYNGYSRWRVSRCF